MRTERKQKTQGSRATVGLMDTGLWLMQNPVSWAIYYARMKAYETCGDLPLGTPTSQVGE